MIANSHILHEFAFAKIPEYLSYLPTLALGGDLPSLGRGPSPIPVPPGSKRNRNDSLADYLPFEPPMFYGPGVPRQALMGFYNNNNNRQKLRRSAMFEFRFAVLQLYMMISPSA